MHDAVSLMAPDADAAKASVELESLRRFVRSIPNLHDLLSVPIIDESEATLRAEMRRHLRALATTLMEAAHIDANGARAVVFRAVSTIAEQLATVSASGIAAASGRDH